MKKTDFYSVDNNYILDCAVSGFHQYVLEAPVHLAFVSLSLCEMTGYHREDFLSETTDLFASLVHPADRDIYDGLLAAASVQEQTAEAEYRLVKKDGSVIYVRDSLTSFRDADGSMLGFSVLTDITGIRRENDNLRFLNETIPCGFIKYTCEKQPRITYMNDKMLEFLRIPKSRNGEVDYLKMYSSNIFIMIPIADRSKFALYLNRVFSAGMPLAGEINIIRCDGTRGRLFGWVTKAVNKDGESEFQSVCIDVTERYNAKKARDTNRYLKALTEVYDRIFEYDLSAGTVKCLYSHDSPVYRWLENIPMPVEEANERWISTAVASEDRGKVKKFFAAFRRRPPAAGESAPLQITYREVAEGKAETFRGVMIAINGSVSFYCCRRLHDPADTEALRSENISLKENMQEIVMRFHDGAAAFEITDGNVTPLYASDNLCEFFGFTRSEWLPLMQKSTPIAEFLSRSESSYGDFAELLRSGEAEFTYYDFSAEMERRIRAICSPKSPEASPRYVLLYNMDEQSSALPAADESEKKVSIRTFGYFDVFIGGKPIAFRSQKAKELFALLTDRRGGFVTSDEAIGFLWEDESVTPVTLARYRKVALRLKNTLEEYGISDVVESVAGKRRLVTDKVRCDLYDYLSGNEEYSQLFKGSYLTNYSWGEITLGELAREE